MSHFLAAEIVSYDLAMTGLRRVSTDLPELDRTNDPRGGAVIWALFIVTATLATVVVSIIWFW